MNLLCKGNMACCTKTWACIASSSSEAPPVILHSQVLFQEIPEKLSTSWKVRLLFQKQCLVGEKNSKANLSIRAHQMFLMLNKMKQAVEAVKKGLKEFSAISLNPKCTIWLSQSTYSVLKEKFTPGKENASLSLVLSLHSFLLWSAVLCTDCLHCSTGECGGWVMSFSFPFSI